MVLKVYMGSSKQLGFGIVGCGRIAPRHVDSILSCDDAKLVAVADVVEERAMLFSSRYSVDYYTDYHDMLERDDIDVVSICTPSGTHPEIGIDVARSGKHVIVEKPMALTLIEADRLIDECKKNRVKLCVVFQNRFNLPVQKLRRALENGRLGRLTHGSAVVQWRRKQAYYDSDSWRGTYALDGGALMNQAIHTIDLLQWMLGPVEEVFGYTETLLRNIEAEDIGLAALKFKNGALGTILATTTMSPKDLTGSLSVFGEFGSVVIGGMAANEISVWQFEGNSSEQADDTEASEIPNVYGFGHEDVVRDMVGAIREDREPYVNGPEGRKALEVILGIYRSAETGLSMRFPLREESERILKARGMA
jgi:UDP-N-acetyl-2-amino-2-deoxyglucuronate dehydrogenase